MFTNYVPQKVWYDFDRAQPVPIGLSGLKVGLKEGPIGPKEGPIDLKQGLIGPKK